ncbi:tumor necrosis factor receptor superfamily member 11A isoform X2 [Protopterus annectens]|uniref:tumor necrosis factor receptor superfamily member 11A isoform X2 n=1 Tax=Protopterus annectens TaxID=7888 RepID=UPI001CFA74F0|nr:tumor necrosis factor receptor superfamily member 11A isoform X2 [Protopterus annectens]
MVRDRLKTALGERILGVRRTMITVFLCYVGQSLPLDDGTKCDAKYNYEHEGRCCSKCEPGYYMSAKCTKSSESVCSPCETDEYMEHWNTEDRCEKQMFCDPGKGFINDHPDTVKAKVTCICKPGFHCSATCEFCQQDTECPPGSGIRNDDKHGGKKCERCPSGYFSNVSSSWEACIPWTNCTAIRKIEQISGTETSDTICVDYPDQENKVWIALSVAIFSAVIIGAFTLLVICYKKNGKSLSASLQHCLSEARFGTEGNQDPCNDTERPHDEKNNEKQDLLSTKEEKKLHNSTGCMGYLCEDVTSSSCCSSENETSMGEDRALLTQRGPTEDEYVEQNVPPYHSASLQAEESDIFGQNAPLLQDFQDFRDGDYNLETTTDDNYLPNSSLPVTRKNVASSPTTSDQLCCPSASFESSKQPHKSLKDPCNFVSGNGDTSPENLCSVLCSHCKDCKNITHDPSRSGAGSEHPFDSIPGVCCCSSMNTLGTDRSPKHCSCDQETTAGNVNGTNNTTFVSSGQVMNFKGDVIVVYVSHDLQDSENINGSSMKNPGSPVQEENRNHGKSFAQNPEETQDSLYSDIKLPYTKPEQKSIGIDGFAVETEFAAYDMHQTYNGRCSQITATVPIQEEGYPERVSKEYSS